MFHLSLQFGCISAYKLEKDAFISLCIRRVFWSIMSPAGWACCANLHFEALSVLLGCSFYTVSISSSQSTPANQLCRLMIHDGCFYLTELGVQGSLGLTGPKALRKIGVLSGGEKARVALAIFVMIPYNLLMLDEPSNHLGESNP